MVVITSVSGMVIVTGRSRCVVGVARLERRAVDRALLRRQPPPAAGSAHRRRRLVLYTSKPTQQALTHEFSSSDGLGAMVEKMVMYCQKQDCMADLLAEVKEANARRYARCEGNLLTKA